MTTGPDRWAALFADLEAQHDAESAAELDAEVRDRTRGELARLRLVDRLAASVGHGVAVQVVGAGIVRGTLAAAGPDWLLVEEVSAAEVLVAVSAVTGIGGLGPHSVTPTAAAAAVRARLGLAHALRGLARSRTPVALTTADARVVHGTLDRVGSDYVDVAEHAVGEARRTASVRGLRTIPMAAIATVTAR